MDDPRDLEFEHVADIPGKMELGDGITIEFFEEPMRCELTQGDQRIVLERPKTMLHLWQWLEAFRDALFAHGKKMKAKPH